MNINFRAGITDKDKRFHVNGGGADDYRRRVLLLKLAKETFTTSMNGSISYIITKNRVRRFRMNKSINVNPSIPVACKMVLNDVRNYEADNNCFNVREMPKVYVNDGALNDFLYHNDSKELCLVDVKACYWTMLLNRGVITQKTYDKFLDNKIARLVAIGNLKKRTNKRLYSKGEEGVVEVIPNSHEWVWNWVVAEAYKLYMKVSEELKGRLLMFKTDCFYVAKNDVAIVQKVVEGFGLNHTLETRKIVGYHRTSIMTEREDGRIVRLAFGRGTKLKDVLPKFDIGTLPPKFETQEVHVDVLVDTVVDAISDYKLNWVQMDARNILRLKNKGVVSDEEREKLEKITSFEYGKRVIVGREKMPQEIIYYHINEDNQSICLTGMIETELNLARKILKESGKTEAQINEYVNRKRLKVRKEKIQKILNKQQWKTN